MNTRNKEKYRNPSISESISVSLGLQYQDQYNNNENSQNSKYKMPANFNKSNAFLQNDGSYVGRSYVSGFLSSSPSLKRPSKNELNGLPVSSSLYNKPIHESQKLHNQTAEIARDFDRLSMDDDSIKNYIDYIEEENENEENLNQNELIPSLEIEQIGSQMDVENNPSSLELSEEETDEFSRLLLSPMVSRTSRLNGTNTRSSYNSLALPSYSTQTTGLGNKIASYSSQFMHYLPASVLGLLLNMLDALSYGMIIFPITEPIFSELGPTGLSMFYISTIVSQVIYSGGWSNFPSGLGGEMIEVTPFFHTMAIAIMNALPLENQKDEVITTTIFCYCISAIFTGLIFLGLGKLKLGKIVGFFPRHILIGCIGGVGYFLLVTGIEVCTRAVKFEYSVPFISHLFTDAETLSKWLLPTLLTVILVLTQKYFQNSLVLPSFYILALCLFHFIVAILPNLSLDSLRDKGWIFPIASSNSKWYVHYKLFDLSKVHWFLVLKQIPTMLALTFFGILHVPINVPALAMSLEMDKYDVDKELIAHGWSNLISGSLGSVQNYLVYTNSVLFIRAGADSAFAGYILIGLTIFVMLIGPVIISYIPICIVTSLIFLLGYELLAEALWDTLGKLTPFEYITVVIIVITMGAFDFVFGIIVGILIACFKFLVDSTKLQTVNGEFDGTVAKSTVARDLIQSTFLDGIAEQIYVLKLQNILFFGTIISIEEKIDKLLEISDNDSSKRRIKYLILDFKNINADNIDYSAAEGFNRIKRFTQSKNIQLIISSIRARDHIYNSFNNVGLLQDVELFNDLNSALEWCENEFLFKYRQLREKAKEKLQDNRNKISSMNTTSGIGSQSARTYYNGPSIANTPRNYQMLHVAQNVFRNEEQTTNVLAENVNEFLETEEPILTLLLLALKQYKPDIISINKTTSESEILLWSQLCPYFTKTTLPEQSTINHNSNIFFIVENGILKATYKLLQGNVYETMSTRTCYGKIIKTSDPSDGGRVIGFDSLEIKVETDSVLWIIDSEALHRLRKENIELFLELTLLIMEIRDIRFKDMLGYALVSS